MSAHDDPEYQQAGAAADAAGSVSAVPLYSVWGLAAAAAAVAILNDRMFSIVAYGVLLVVGIALLIVYRMSVVRASMSADGAAVGVQTLERFTVLAIVLGCLANGIVIGLWVGSLEYWFR